MFTRCNHLASFLNFGLFKECALAVNLVTSNVSQELAGLVVNDFVLLDFLVLIDFFLLLRSAKYVTELLLARYVAVNFGGGRG